MINEMNPWLHIGEWKEGGSLWLRHIFLPPQHYMRGVRLCMERLFPDFQCARQLIHRKGKLMAVEFDREYLQRLISKAGRRWAGI